MGKPPSNLVMGMMCEYETTMKKEYYLQSNIY